MKNDIEQRAEEYAVKLGYFKPSTPVVRDTYIAGATEERERGKRFNKWMVINQYGYSHFFNEYIHHTHIGTWSYDKLFDQFLLEEKALNN